MAKIKPSAQSGKLTQVELTEIADKLQSYHPYLAEVIRKQGDVNRLEAVLKAHGLLRIEQKTARFMSGYILPEDVFAEMANVASVTDKEKQMERGIREQPAVGTEEWVFKMFPDARIHFCRLLIDADEAYKLLRDLTVNYNYTGIEPEEIPSFLAFINDFCNVLRPLAEIQKKRIRAISHVKRHASSWQLNGSDGNKAA